MAEIRPLQQIDLPAVAALLHANLTPDVTEDHITRDLQARLIDDPWRDEELPSLVAAENGRIVGFIASQVRRFTLDGKPLRGICCSDLTVAPESRGGATGALLLRRLLGAGQDITFSDTANLEVARMWQTFGGQLDNARACDWMVVLHPMRWLRGLASGAIKGQDLGRGQIPVPALPLQALRRNRGRWALPEPEPDVRGEDADAATIAANLEEMARGIRLRVDYDELFLNHLFKSIESRFGAIATRMVRRDDRPVGWYAYVPKRGGVSRVMHLLATGADPDADAVLADLVAHAHSQRSAVIAGRHEPHLTRALHRNFSWTVFGFAQRPVLHCHDAEILAVLATGGSVLTRFDGEWFVT